MTQFTISPRLYPAYALPMLMVTIITATIMPSILAQWDRWKSRRRDLVRKVLHLQKKLQMRERGRSLERADDGSVFKHRIRSLSLDTK